MRGSRLGAFQTFAEQYQGRGLTVMRHTTARRLVFEGRRVMGVEVARFVIFLILLLLNQVWGDTAVKGW